MDKGEEARDSRHYIDGERVFAGRRRPNHEPLHLVRSCFDTSARTEWGIRLSKRFDPWQEDKGA
jgi:hypothetical protein